MSQTDIFQNKRSSGGFIITVHVSHLFSFQINLEYFEQPFRDVRKFVLKDIENHRENFDPDNIRDLVDLYLQAEKNGFKDHEGMDGICVFFEQITFKHKFVCLILITAENNWNQVTVGQYGQLKNKFNHDMILIQVTSSELKQGQSEQGVNSVACSKSLKRLIQNIF